MSVACKPVDPLFGSSSVAVSSISLSHTLLELYPEETFELTAEILPENASDKTIAWLSSNTDVATVVDGKITAVGIGSATIVAQAGNIKAECSVTVEPVDVTAIRLDKTSLELYPKETEVLVATVLPENATYKQVSWSVSDSGVAIVDDNGKVTAVSPGTTRIYAKTDTRFAYCTVRVKPIDVSYIGFDKDTITMLSGEREFLTLTIEPANAIDNGVKWSTSDSSVAAIENGEIFAYKVGTSEITANVGNVRACCKVFVLPTSLSFSITNITMTVGGQQDITTFLLPEDTPYSALTWISSAPDVVSVADGILRSRQKGTATITVKSTNGLSAECNVTVVDNNPDAGESEGTGEVEW